MIIYFQCFTNSDTDIHPYVIAENNPEISSYKVEFTVYMNTSRKAFDYTELENEIVEESREHKTYIFAAFTPKLARRALYTSLPTLAVTHSNKYNIYL